MYVIVESLHIPLGIIFLSDRSLFNSIKPKRTSLFRHILVHEAVTQYSETYLNRILSNPNTYLNQTDFTFPSTKCLCNVKNMSKVNSSVSKGVRFRLVITVLQIHDSKWGGGGGGGGGRCRRGRMVVGHLQFPMESASIATNDVSSNLAEEKCNRYNNI